MTLARTLLLAVAASGCGRSTTSDATPAPSTSVTTPPTTAASAAEPARDLWYAGAWSGKYEATKHRIELSTKVGGLAEWAVDDGSRGTGSGTLSLTPDDKGTATGSMEGPLGPAALVGAFDGDTLAVRFYPKSEDRSGFSGVMVLKRDGDQLKGSLDGATADGHVARTATVALQRTKP